MAARSARRAELGQFFTPRPVAEFAVEALLALGLGRGRLRVADPACGEGVFLQAVARRLPQAELWGCDVDGALAARWRAAGLREPRAHMAVHDGLVDGPLFGLGAGTFDVVVGNPPYGFGVPRPEGRERIEERFVRRFVEMTRPGGWLAAVVPEGIVANARCQALRDWVLERAALKAVVALPEATFAAAGTRARTVLLMARRQRRGGGQALLASAGAGAGLEGYLAEVLERMRSGS